MDWFDQVTVVNRTSQRLTAMVDGRQFVFPPYPAQVKIPRFAADLACRQLPVMGTENPFAPSQFECLIHVIEWHGDEVTPTEQSEAIERLDRSQIDLPTLPDGRGVGAFATIGRVADHRKLALAGIHDRAGAEAIFATPEGSVG